VGIASVLVGVAAVGAVGVRGVAGIDSDDPHAASASISNTAPANRLAARADAMTSPMPPIRVTTTRPDARIRFLLALPAGHHRQRALRVVQVSRACQGCEIEW
jgi:hypothetical protein